MALSREIYKAFEDVVGARNISEDIGDTGKLPGDPVAVL